MVFSGQLGSGVDKIWSIFLFAKVDEQDSDWETIIEDCEKGSEIEFPAIDEDCENWAEKYTTSIRRFHNSGNFSSQTDIKETKCPNCGGAFNPHHQC